MAAANGESKVCNTLLHHEALTHLLKNKNETILWLSLEKGHTDMCNLQLICGGSLDITD